MGVREITDFYSHSLFFFFRRMRISMGFKALKGTDKKEAVKAKITVVCPIMLFTNQEISIWCSCNNATKWK